MIDQAKLTVAAVLGAILCSAGPTQAGSKPAIVGSSVKLRATLSAYHDTGRVDLKYDTSNSEFVAALVAGSPAAIRVVDAGDFDVTLNVESCLDTPRKVRCTGDDGDSVITLLRRKEGSPALYRLIARRTKLTMPKAGLVTPQVPVQVTLVVGTATTGALTSSACESKKPLRLQCETTFDRNVVNTAPSLTPGSDIFLDSRPPDTPEGQCVNDSGVFPGPQSIPGWASILSPGPPSEAGQSLSLKTEVLSTSGTLAFDDAPSVNVADGTLTFALTPGTYGTAEVQLTLQDNGGTAGGGADSFTTTFEITMNSPPVVFDQLVAGVTGSPCILINPFLFATDVDGPLSPLEGGSSDVVYHSTLNGVLFWAEDYASLCYRPRRFFVGEDSFWLTVSDCQGGVSERAYVNIIVFELP